MTLRRKKIVGERGAKVAVNMSLMILIGWE